MKDTVNLKLDPTELTIGDVEDLERETGKPLPALEAMMRVGEYGKDYTMKDVVPIVWVLLRRTQPDLTLDDVRKMRFTEVEFVNPQ